jgi:adenylate cyclase
MVMAKMQSPPDDAGFADREKVYEAKGLEIDQEAQAARHLINAIIEDLSTESDNARLGRIDVRIENVNNDLRRYLGEENKRLMPLLETGNFAEIRASLAVPKSLRQVKKEG